METFTVTITEVTENGQQQQGFVSGTENVPSSDDETKLDVNERDNIKGLDIAILYTSEELYESLQNEDGRQLADMIWDNQRFSGLYQYSVDELRQKNLLTYYISSSEGDDRNNGRTPEQPKKTLDSFSGVSNVNLMLKCGDTFSLDDTFPIISLQKALLELIIH